MSQPSLHKQLESQRLQVLSAVSRLSSTDPMKLWFECEIAALNSDENDALEDTNSKLSALRQLKQLLFEHCVKVQNRSQLTKPLDTLPMSYLSQQAQIPSHVLDMAKEKRFSIDPQLLFAKDWDNDQFDPVSPTAKIVGYLRSRDKSLSFAAQPAMEKEGKELLSQLSDVDAKTVQLMAALFQCRYHTVNAAIANSGASQVIELASGISPRGLQWARSVPDSIFVETDLPALMIHKSKLLRGQILDSTEINAGILHCAGADVLNLDSIREALTAIDRELPFVIVSEGLLLYLSTDELNVLMGHMASILRDHPQATWIADFVSKANLGELLESSPGVAHAVRKVFSMTGREVIGANPFQSDECITAMLAENQLEVRSRIDLVQIENTRDKQPSDEVLEMLGSRRIWTISSPPILR